MSSTLKLYPIPSNQWRKSLEEIRRFGHKAYLARDCNRIAHRTPLYGPYVIATGKPAEAIYVRKAIGPIEPGDARRMLLTGRVRKRPTPTIANPYSIGQAVLIGEIPCTVAATDGPLCVIAWTMVGKQHLKPVHYSRLRPG
jgi:hypothetical protein